MPEQMAPPQPELCPAHGADRRNTSEYSCRGHDLFLASLPQFSVQATVREITMAHSIVLRFKGLFPNQLGKFSMYARRCGGDLSHVDETKSALNETVIGGPHWVKQLRAKIADVAGANLAHEIEALRARQRPADARAVLARGPVDPWKFTRIGPLREGILTVHKDWFGGSGADNWIPERVAAFRARGIAFLTESFGETCVHARIEHDEEALHFHFVLAPWHEKRSASRGHQRLLQPSSHPLIKDYEHAQDHVAEYFTELGITRGARHAEARRGARARGVALPPRPVHVPPGVWRAQQQLKIAQARDEIDDRAAALDWQEEKSTALVRVLHAVEKEEILFVRGATWTEDQLTRGPAYPEDRPERMRLKEAMVLCETELHNHLRAMAAAAQRAQATEYARLADKAHVLAKLEAQLSERDAQHCEARKKIMRTTQLIAQDLRAIAAFSDEHDVSLSPQLAGILARYIKANPEARPIR